MLYLFDLDGTLLDSNGIWLDIDVAYLGRIGVSPVPQEYTDYVTHHGFLESAVYTKERFALDESPEEIVASWREMGREAYGGTLALKPGARALLQRLERDGVRMALFTSCVPELCRLALECHGLTGYFERVLTTAEAGLEKRSAESYRTAAQMLGVSPGECVFLDDSPVYCAAATEAGMHTIGVWDELFADREGELRGICNRYVRSLEELL